MAQTRSTFFSALQSSTFFGLLLLSFTFSLSAQVATPGMNLSARLTTVGNLYRVEIGFEVDRLSRVSTPKDVLLIYQLLTADSSKATPADTLFLENEPVLKVNSTFYYNLSISPLNPSFVRLSLRIQDTTTGLATARQYNFAASAPALEYGMKNLTNPNYGNYAMTTDSILFNAKADFGLVAYFFNSEFDPAPPPMVTDFKPTQAQLRVKKRLRFSTNEKITFPEEGLYFVQSDTLGSEGIGFRVFTRDFPKYRKIEHLAETMIYISTNAEMNSLETAVDKRPVFDNFWLNLGGTVLNAKRMIKLYFQRVAHANQNYTNYKPGWKTDQGMIHIIFGEPDNIIYSSNSERWEYYSGKVTFDFFKKKNTFSGYHFELSRSEAFKDEWYSAVKKWREGEVRP